MATVVDKSGNTPSGTTNGVDAHIASPSENSEDKLDEVVTAVEAVKTVLDTHTTILTDIETNTTPV